MFTFGNTPAAILLQEELSLSDPYIQRKISRRIHGFQTRINQLDILKEKPIYKDVLWLLYNDFQHATVVDYGYLNNLMFNVCQSIVKQKIESINYETILC
jgi:hypothetical protein